MSSVIAQAKAAVAALFSPVASWHRLLPILLLLVLVPQIAIAAEKAVIEYDSHVEGDTDWLEVSGNVAFYYQEVTIRADRLRMAWDTEVAHFTGSVRVESDGLEFTGDEFIYDLPAGTSLLIEPRTAMEADGVEGPIILRGDRMVSEAGRTLFEGARLTTCGCTETGYYLAAARLEVVPGDRVVLHHVRFVEFGVTLFYWPRLTISLSDPREIALPEIGHSAREGWYVKTSHPYGPHGAGGGYLHLDWMQRLGLGAGVTHRYRQDEEGHGTIRAYGIARSEYGVVDHSLAWEGAAKVGTWETAWTADYDASPIPDAPYREMEGELSVSQRRAAGETALRLSGSRLEEDGLRNDEYTGTLRVTQRLTPSNVRLRLSGEAILTPGARRLFGYAVEVNQATGPITWSVAADERFHPSLSTDEAAPPWLSSGRRPEIVVGARPEIAPFGFRLPLQFELGWGQFSERRSLLGEVVSVRGGRATAMAGIRNRSIPLGDRLTLRYSGYARGYRYDEGQSRFILSSTTQATLRITDRLSLNGTYSYLDEFGHASPFRFDRATPTDRIRGTLQYRSVPLTLSLGSGYNFLTRRPEDVTLRVDAQPLETISLRFQTAYSLANREPLYAAGTVELDAGDSLKLQLGTKYLFGTGSFERVDAALAWQVGDWDVSYTAIYDVLEGQFEHGHLSVLRNLDDCRLLGISYDQARQAVWLDYRITAFPQAGLRVGAEESRLMFDVDGWQELIGQ